jgi:hypothetical protein
MSLRRWGQSASLLDNLADSLPCLSQRTANLAKSLTFLPPPPHFFLLACYQPMPNG